MTTPGIFSAGDRVVWRSAIAKPLPGASYAPPTIARAARVTDQQGSHVWVAYDDTRELAQLYAYTGRDQHVWHAGEYAALSEADPVSFPAPTGASS